ncbi:pre-mRNA-splicing factor CWC25-like protein [Dinothrombium tinctorium]|uniref:Pre-mRNA-splicing factor CWC25-like protein n=1 Tax=Dinothrombium tinctorium TaxID=1965070 RepID=A0A3S4RCM3_9ACAR|nr:pre-mRNA-splicing factor CWC25-like protein [Dinothrombium tinctorium]RWS14498.1 pre-mRNA-splicing factor CWC25-like protein [Dinothrombium tinctorium]
MSENKIEFMYKNVSEIVDKEEYLLGRKVDKTFEFMRQEEEKQKGDFTVDENDFTKSLFDRQATSTVTVDLSTKVREDPLYEIKKKQVEERKKIMDNPIKMKRIKQLLESALKEDESDNNTDSSYSSDSSRSSDRDIKRRKHRKLSRERRPSSHRKHRESRSYRHKDASRRSSRKSSSRKHRHSSRERYSKSSSKSRERREERSNNDKQRESRSNMHQRLLAKKNAKQEKRKMTDEELEKRRQEMMSNAAWREEQRKRNVRDLEEEEKREIETLSKEKGSSFIRPLINSAIEKSSVEERVKQRIFNTQRDQNAMDKSFARR